MFSIQFYFFVIFKKRKCFRTFFFIIISGLNIFFCHGLGLFHFPYLVTLFLFNSTQFISIQINSIQFKYVQLFSIQFYSIFFICFKTASIFELFQILLSFCTMVLGLHIFNTLHIQAHVTQSSYPFQFNSIQLFLLYFKKNMFKNIINFELFQI